MINTPKTPQNPNKNLGKNLSKQEVYELLNAARIPEDADEYDSHSDDGLVVQGSDINKATTKEQKERNKQDAEREKNDSERLAQEEKDRLLQEEKEKMEEERKKAKEKDDAERLAQEEKEKLENQKIEDIRLLKNYIWIQKEDKWGIADKKGNWIVKPKFDSQKVLRNGKVQVMIEKDGKEMYGITDFKGKELLGTNFKAFGNGNLGYSDLYTIKDKSGLYGIIDLSGDECNVIVTPKFESIKSIGDDLFYVGVDKDNKTLYGVINKKGERVFEPQFDGSLMSPYSYQTFGDVIATVTSKNDNPVIIDNQGNILRTLNKKIIPGNYHYAFMKLSKDGNIIVYCRDDGSQSFAGLIDKDNNWIIRPKFNSLYSFEKDGTAKAIIKQGDQELRGVIDKNGDWIIRPKFNDLYSFEKDGTAKASIKQGDQELRGVIDKNGDWIIHPNFTKIDSFEKDSTTKASIKEGNQELRGLIDKKGNWIIQPKFTYLNYSNKEATDRNGDYVTINKKGEVVKNYGNNIDYMFSFTQGKAFIRGKNLLYGIINKDGSMILEPRFSNYSSFNENGLAIVSIEEDGKILYGVINRNGKETIPIIYDKLIRLEDDVENYILEDFLKRLSSMKISVTKNTYLGLRNNKIYIINKDGKEQEIKIKY